MSTRDFSGFSAFITRSLCGTARLTSYLLLRGSNYLIGFEPKLPLQFLKRRRSPERLHTDDPTGCAGVTLPAESGSLLHHNASLNARWQHAFAVFFCLALKNLPG